MAKRNVLTELFYWEWEGVLVPLNMQREFSIPGQIQSVCKVSSLLSGFVLWSLSYSTRADKSGKYQFNPEY